MGRKHSVVVRFNWTMRFAHAELEKARLAMLVLVYSVTLVACALVIHLSVWRARLPRKQTTALLTIFFGVLVAGLAMGFSRLTAQLTPIEAAHIALVHTAFALAYICLYSAIENGSPSTAIVSLTAAAGPPGCRRDDYKAIINDNLLIGSRFQAMIRDGLVTEADGRYRLTQRGEFLARLFNHASRLLHMSGAG